MLKRIEIINNIQNWCKYGENEIPIVQKNEIKTSIIHHVDCALRNIISEKLNCKFVNNQKNGAIYSKIKSKLFQEIKTCQKTREKLEILFYNSPNEFKNYLIFLFDQFFMSFNLYFLYHMALTFIKF